MPDLAERFVAMPADELADFFRTTDVLEITDLIRSASDADLHRLIELDHFREAGVVAILDRFAEFADPVRLAEIRGVVRFELARPRQADECHTARFESGTVTLDSSADPDVTIAADLVDFVRRWPPPPAKHMRAESSVPRQGGGPHALGGLPDRGSQRR